MPAAKGRNRKARRAAAAGAASPATNSPPEPASKLVGTTAPAGKEKQRRQKQRQTQLKERDGAAISALPGNTIWSSKGAGVGKESKHDSGGAAKKKKEKSPASSDGGGDIADLDADDFLSGGFMSMAGLSHDQDRGDSGRESESDNDADDSGEDAAGVGKGGGAGEEEEEDSADSDDEEANANAMDLKGLAETDPEFFSFLQKEEPTLLEFDPMDSDDSEGEEGGGGSGVAEEEAGAGGGEGAPKSPAALLREAAKVGGGVPLTMALLHAMRQEAFDRSSIQGVRRMIKAFRCGCHLGDESSEAKGGGGSGGTVLQKFRIPSSEVYNELMVCSLEGLHVAFMRLLFPGRELTVAATAPAPAAALAAAPAAAGPIEDGGNNGGRGAAKKRRRGEGTEEGGEEEEEEDGAAAAAAATAAGGRSGPEKKRTRKDKGKKGGGATAADDDGGGPGGPGAGGGEATVLQVIAGAGGGGGGGGGNTAATPGGGGGTAAPGGSAVVLTKEDFRSAAQLPAWKPMQPAIYSFFKSLLHVLEELHDRGLLAFLLSRLEHYIPLLVPFPGLARGFLKALLGLWGGAGAEAKSSGGGTDEESEEAERVRLLAYLRVRQMAEVLPFPFVEGCMKRLYLAFAKRARAPPASQAGKASLRLMEGCVVELYGTEVGSAYQNAFLYIRQLSLLLRRAMQHKTRDAVQSVRRWQVVTCLRVWTGVLAAAPGEDELRTLIFPLAQVIEGIVRLSGTLRHSPLVFQLVRMRHRLAAAAELYVPCSTPLLEVLRSPALYKKATASTGAPPNVPDILRLSKTQVDEGRAQGAVVEEALRLLGQEMDLYRYSAAFPELVIPVLGHVKKFAKLTKVSKWRMMSRGLAETLEARGTWAAERRLELRLCPSDVDGLEVLRPNGAPTMRERLGASEAEVERAIDDEAPAAKANAGGGALAAPKGKKAANKSETKGRLEGDSNSEHSDGEDGFTAPKRKKKGASLSSIPSPERGGRGGKAKTPQTIAASVPADGEISAPDLVEDLGAWSDNEWA